MVNTPYLNKKYILIRFPKKPSSHPVGTLELSQTGLKIGQKYLLTLFQLFQDKSGIDLNFFLLFKKAILLFSGKTSSVQ